MANKKIMSPREKECLRAIVEPSELLPYETRELKMPAGYEDATEYVIPPDDRKRLLDELYPFHNPPQLNEVVFDIHSERTFTAGDFKIIREDGRNYLVSPYYAESGGMVIDWMDESSAEDIQVDVDWTRDPDWAPIDPNQLPDEGTLKQAAGDVLAMTKRPNREKIWINPIKAPRKAPSPLNDDPKGDEA